MQARAEVRRRAMRSALWFAGWIAVAQVVGDLIFARERLASGGRWVEIGVIAIFTGVVRYVVNVYGDVVLWRGRPEARGVEVLPKAEEKRGGEET